MFIIKNNSNLKNSLNLYDKKDRIKVMKKNTAKTLGFITVSLTLLTLITDWRDFLLEIIILTSLGTLFFYLLDKKDEEINHYKSLLERYGFDYVNLYNHLQKYETKEVYNEFCERFVSYHQNVLGVQLYDYSLSIKSNNYTIRLKYDQGYIDSEVSSNAIIQDVYKFDRNKVKDLKKAINLLEVNQDFDPLIKFIKEKSMDGTYNEDENFILLNFALDTVLRRITEEEFSSQENYKKFITFLRLVYEKIYDARSSGKRRIGITEAILLHEPIDNSTTHDFPYDGINDEKSTRNYLTHIIHTVSGEKKLFLIAYDLGKDNNMTQRNILELEEGIRKSFKDLLIEYKLVKNIENERSSSYGGAQNF